MADAGSEIQILFEDRYILALAKPAGMHSERREGEGDATVASFLAENFPDAEESTDRWQDAGLVQRLDFQTSGILLAARDKRTRGSLRQISKEQQINKEYLALLEVLEDKPHEHFECTGYIGSPYRRAKKVRVYDEEPGGKHRAKPAHTSFSISEHLPSINAALALASCSTGRRHQVRAHAAHCSFPLLGDSLYGSTRPLVNREEGEFLLHASSVELSHPVSGKRLKIDCPVFQNFESILNESRVE